MIPKTIHYCWFGKNPLPELALHCIESWKVFLPDYEIIQWNESNYNVKKIPYIEQAYDAKKYAFVSDYARFDILYEYGGIYFDTDVEVIKPLDDIINRGPFAGLEDPGAINAGLGLGARVHESIYQEILDSYTNDRFIKSDGSMNLYTIVERVSSIFSQYGFTKENKNQIIKDISIYTKDYFCPKNYRTFEINITKNTYSIHHYDASWVSKFHKKYITTTEKLCKCFGVPIGNIIKVFPYLQWKISEYGFIMLFKKIIKRIFKY